ATVHDRASGAPIRNAEVQVQLTWQEGLPYWPGAEPSAPMPAQPLAEKSAGRYEGRLAAPDEQGYYRLEATVTAPGGETLRLEELLLVEAPPAWPEAAAAGDEPELAEAEAPTAEAPPEEAEADDDAELSIPPDRLPHAPPTPQPDDWDLDFAFSSPPADRTRREFP